MIKIKNNLIPAHVLLVPCFYLNLSLSKTFNPGEMVSGMPRSRMANRGSSVLVLAYAGVNLGLTQKKSVLILHRY